MSSNPPASDASNPVITPSRPPQPADSEPVALRHRVGAVISSAVAGVLGILPHVLHHAGPLAGAALLAGTGGTLLFGAIGLLAAIPFLLRVRRRSGSWRVPAALLATFAAMFSISAFVIGPAISDRGESSDAPTPTHPTTPGTATETGHDAHH